jgi:hypothetical protein
MVTIVVAALVLLPLSAVVLARVARRLGIGLSPTEGVRDLGAGWLYNTIGVARTPRSVLNQLGRQAARLHLALTHDRVFAPGEILVELHPEEHAQLARLGRAGSDAVAAAAISAARRHGWSPPQGRTPVVHFRVAPNVRRGRPNLLGTGWGPEERCDRHTRPLSEPADGTSGPRDTRSGRDTTKALRPVSHAVVVVSGSDGRAVVLTDPGRSVVLGRTSVADLRIDSSGVSRVHARISLHPGGAQVEDLGSTNGTFVDGIRLSGPMLVTGLAVVRLGVDGPTINVNPHAAAATAPTSTGADR